MPVFQQSFAQMASYETRASCDNKLHNATKYKAYFKLFQ
jgi:hypothetical protein